MYVCTCTCTRGPSKANTLYLHCSVIQHQVSEGLRGVSVVGHWRGGVGLSRPLVLLETLDTGTGPLREGGREGGRETQRERGREDQMNR